jgi:hypothetical protein
MLKKRGIRSRPKRGPQCGSRVVKLGALEGRRLLYLSIIHIAIIRDDFGLGWNANHHLDRFANPAQCRPQAGVNWSQVDRGVTI